MTKLLVNFAGKWFTYYSLKNPVIYSLVLLFQLMMQENIVKVVSRYAVSSVTVYTIWGVFVFRYTLEIPSNEKLEDRRVLCNKRKGEPLHILLVVMRVTVSNSSTLYPIVVGEEGSISCSL